MKTNQNLTQFPRRVQQESKPPWAHSTDAPALRFTPTAWAKLLFLRDYGHVEVGGFGISPSETLLVEDIQLIKQSCEEASVSFDDEAVADFFEQKVDEDLRPEQFGRIWIHTHPGASPEPSWVDEQTFRRVFGRCDWAVMFILSQTGATYARLRFNVGPGGSLEIPVQVDFTSDFPASNMDDWEDEYLNCVDEEQPFTFREAMRTEDQAGETDEQKPLAEPWSDSWFTCFNEFDEIKAAAKEPVAYRSRSE